MFYLDYLEVWPAYVPAGLPGSLTGLCTTWITWKYARPMFQLVYLEVWPAYVPPGLPESMPGLCTNWFTWKFDRPMYQLDTYLILVCWSSVFHLGICRGFFLGTNDHLLEEWYLLCLWIDPSDHCRFDLVYLEVWRPMYHLDYLEVCPAKVPAGLPGSMPGLSTSWFTWKFDRPMYQLVYLEVWPAYVPAGLPGSMTGQCIWW